MEEIINELNKDQKEAVKSTQGPQLILAGAGSGKTRVVTTKISYLINEKNVNDYEILAFTFTNKAANEMKERISQLLGKNVDSMWIGTFHSICVRILRINMNLDGYSRDFSIYDTADQRVVLRDAIRALNLDEKTYRVNNIQARISSLKNQGLSSEDFENLAASYLEENVSKIYRIYQETLKNNNALDFDDLIIKTIELLKRDDEIRDYYQDKFKFVFVDEYQDTNNPQYELIKLLSGKYKNLTVVGDADQSIYGWRGANINNILDFEDDYDQVNRVNLNQNYRSSKKILDTANKLIESNDSRFEKDLWTQNNEGSKPELYEIEDSISEAKFVVSNIKEAIEQGQDPSEIAILYRSNSISRAFEEELMKASIAYKVIGGIKFYDRAEIKDFMAYLQIIVNQDDDVALKRIINKPKRGIGETSLEKLENLASSKALSMYEALDHIAEYEEFDSRARSNLSDFKDMIDDFIVREKSYGLVELFDYINEKTGYEEELEAEKTIESRSKIDNINEFRSSLEIYEKENGPDLANYLAEVSLMSDVDKTEDVDGVSLMTVHGAKGLEFDRVYIVALEEGVFPSSYCESQEELEEERRLMYVAITRTRKDLIMTYAKRRTLYGKSNHSLKSQFLDELGDSVQTNEPISQAPLRRVNRQKHFNKKVDMKFYKPSDDDSRKINSQKNYEIGQEVSHKKWGNGTIVKLEESDGDTKITIVFDDVGPKVLLQSFAPLKVITSG